jgi:hypothetical protein
MEPNGIDPAETAAVDTTPIDVLVSELEELLDACFMEEVAPAVEAARRSHPGEAA